MEKSLTTEQSLDIIARMIASTRQNFNERGGAMFLIWGYTTIAVTLAVTLLLAVFHNQSAHFLWWVLPVVGGVLSWLHLRKQSKPVVTHLDRSIWAVWNVFSIATICCMVSIYGVYFCTGRVYINILFTIGLLSSMGTAITGRIISYAPVAAGGVAGMLLSFVIPALDGSIWQLPFFAFIFLVAQIIPGHLLDAECRRESAAQNGRAE